MTKPISLLRQRMIDDMKIRNMSMSTQDAYIRAVAKFSAFCAVAILKLAHHGGST